MLQAGVLRVTELPWQELRGALHRFVAPRVGASDADDVVQDALVRIHRGVGQLRDHERMTAWIYQVARSAIADHGRRRRGEVALDPEAEVAAPPAEPPAVDGVAFARLARCVPPFVALLRSPYREAIALVELDGVSQVEAAARLGVPLSTLKSRVQRGRVQLRALLEQCCAIELDARCHVVDLVPRPIPPCAAPAAAERSA
jgi:RNA polymerase sigma-70 factor, ECF subfamily